MKAGSLFSGIGGGDLGLERAGFRVAWQVEIDDACNRVLARHWPDVKRYRDVRECGAHNLEPVDIICGGFPCQDLSVAGQRKGLAGERSGLWFEFHRILAECRPRWVVIENVPGLRSSPPGANGRDMAIVLSGLVGLGYRVAWRSLDVRYFGLAQRRERVFIVGNTRDGSAAQVLFESEGGCWNPPPSRKTGQRVAASLTSGSGVTGNAPGRRREDDVNLVAACLEAHASRYDYETETLVASPLTTNAYADRAAEESNLVCAHETGKGFWTEGLPGLRAQPGGMPENLVAHILRAEGADASEDGTGRGVPIVFGWQDSHTTYSPVRRDGIAGSIGTTKKQAVAAGMAVRRLTPLECTRLQGFPDWWLDIEGLSDSAKYRMLGNAVAVPVAEWLGKRIVALEAQPWPSS